MPAQELLSNSLHEKLHPFLEVAVFLAEFFDDQPAKDEQANRLMTQVEELSKLQGTANEQLKELKVGLDGLYQRQGCLEEASRRESFLTEEFHSRHIIVPLAESIFPALDLLQEQLQDSSTQRNEMTSLLEAIYAQVLQTMRNLGLRPLNAETGDAFDPACMQPVKQWPAKTSDEVGKVAKLVRLGFKRGNHLLRPAGVVVFCEHATTEMPSIEMKPTTQLPE